MSQPSTKPLAPWSFSVLDTFENCPKKYFATRIAKTHSDSNEHNRDGAEKHKAFEDYLRKGRPLPADLVQHQPILDKVKASPGQLYVEYDLTITQQFVPTRSTDWDNAWLRVKSDALKVNGGYGIGFDWKWAKPKDDDRQAEITAMAAFQHFPDMHVFKFNYVFLADKYPKDIMPYEFRRAQLGEMWNRWGPKVRRLEQAKLSDSWPATPNPLCGWCPVGNCGYNTNKNLAKRG